MYTFYSAGLFIRMAWDGWFAASMEFLGRRVTVISQHQSARVGNLLLVLRYPLLLATQSSSRNTIQFK